MFCGIGRDKSNKDDCKKPSKIYKHPSISPLTVKKEADKKSPSRVSVSPISFDVESESSKLADELGLLTVGKNSGKAHGLPAYKTKKAGKRRRKKRKTRKRRKTKKKRKRKRKRRKSKRRK